jgi:hypothetical protein
MYVVDMVFWAKIYLCLTKFALFSFTGSSDNATMMFGNDYSFTKKGDCYELLGF